MNVFNLWPLRVWRWAVSWIPFSGWSRRTRSIWISGPLKTGERPEDLHFDFDILPDNKGGQILTAAISGFYPPGSAGNEHARVMQNQVSNKINEIQPSAVLFDLSGLDYVWGDTICCLAVTTIQHSLPSCIYATGRTATALEGIFSIFKPHVKLFRDHENAIVYLGDQLGITPSNIH